ncbi:MAG TPA: protoporphyrinogen oxidase [Sporichthya sp.]|nr:protoporphyrinogen oxidase [Sporichthya sp.]
MHIVVVGGGIAGLAAAWFLRELRGESAAVTVLEAAPQVGGKLGQAEVGGLTVDTGAESVLARRPEAVELIRAVGLSGDLVHPGTNSAGVWSRGHVRALPAEQVMGIPSDLAALARSGIVSTAGVLRAMGDEATPVRPQAEDVAVGAYVGERLGPEIVERLIDPLLGGVYAGHAEQLSMFATLPQFTRAVTEGVPLTTAAAQVRAQAQPGPVFAGIAGGVGRLPAALARHSGAQVRTGVTVQGLSRTPEGWTVLTRSGLTDETLAADAVVLAVPAPAAARLLGAPVPAAAAELAGIAYASMAIVTLVYPPAAGEPPVAGSGFLVPAVDRRLIKAVTLSSAKWEWTAQAAAAAGSGTVLRASVGRLGEEADLQRSDEDLVHGVAVDVAHATGLAGSPVDAQVHRWGGALPQYTVGHLDRVRRIREAVAAVPGLAVCGAAYDGVGIAACVASARLAAERIVGSARADGRMAP